MGASPTAAPRLTELKAGRWTSARGRVARATPGEHVRLPTNELSLIFILDAPVGVNCDYDGRPEARILRPGRFDLLPPQTTARWEDHGASLSLSLWLSESLVQSAALGMKGPRRSGPIEPMLSVDDRRVLGAAMLLRGEIEAETPDILYADSVAAALAVRLLERFGFSESARATATLSRLQFKRVNDYIAEHLDDDLRLSKLAGLVGLSESHFRLLFRQTAGRPVHQHVLELRLERAKQLLQAGDLSIAQVAAETGFCHQSHLASAMVRRWRVKPSELMRNERRARAWRSAK